ncbi:hypothetical protein OUZ56_032315 [Daphnia magna]|uniref:Uncharacterized protein n=1 Tax=Daphnia magna TaxID=35525 RepID=A0ABR0B8J9_9CRUS|nr:hypothetical protein OUZ56_032315 [Daphnia magna]
MGGFGAGCGSTGSSGFLGSGAGSGGSVGAGGVVVTVCGGGGTIGAASLESAANSTVSGSGSVDFVAHTVAVAVAIEGGVAETDERPQRRRPERRLAEGDAAPDRHIKREITAEPAATSKAKRPFEGRSNDDTVIDKNVVTVAISAQTALGGERRVQTPFCDDAQSLICEKIIAESEAEQPLRTGAGAGELLEPANSRAGFRRRKPAFSPGASASQWCRPFAGHRDSNRKSGVDLEAVGDAVRPKNIRRVLLFDGADARPFAGGSRDAENDGAVDPACDKTDAELARGHGFRSADRRKTGVAGMGPGLIGIKTAARDGILAFCMYDGSRREGGDEGEGGSNEAEGTANRGGTHGGATLHDRSPPW